MKTKRSPAVIGLTWLCTAVYFCSYLTRINFSAVIVEMIAAEHYTKTALSVAVTGLSLAYGAGQLLSGYLGDKVRPERLIFIGLLASSVLNLLIPFCGSTLLMTIVWSINGFAQAMMWPPIVKILSSRMNEQDYKNAAARVGWGSSFGTIFVYFTAPLLIVAGSWKTVFVVSAAAAVIMAFAWMGCFRKLDKHFSLEIEAAGEKKAAPGEKRFTPSVILMLGIIMFAIIMQGVLRDGITTWMPTYISDIFEADNSVAIFSSIVLPIFSIACYQFTTWLNERLIKNEMLCAAAIFALGLISLLVLRLFGGSGMIVSVIAIGIAAASMHGVNLVLICMVPAFFKQYGRASLISGILNSCTYLGSAVSTYGVAVLSDALGWDLTVLVWIIVAAVGTVSCLFLIPRWNIFKKAL